MDNLIKLRDAIKQTLAIFDSAGSEALNLDELESELRNVYELLNTRTTAQPAFAGDGNGAAEGKSALSDSELNLLVSEKEQYREFIVRQAEVWMRALNYPDCEVLELLKVSNPAELMKIEERFRKEFDMRFHVQPLAPDKLNTKAQKLQVYKIS